MKKRAEGNESKNPYARVLRNAGYKATPRRMALLETLGELGKPMSVARLCELIPKKANPTTVYRALEDLAVAGVVRKVDLKHSHAHYELAIGSHHHHLICEQCGKIEDVKACEVEHMERYILKRSDSFAVVSDHSLEFFGQCKQCAAVF